MLVVCSHNSARSQMAEAFINQLGEGRFTAESAGLEPASINPYVIDVMKEIGLDLSQNSSDSVFEFFKQGRLYDYVITVCNASENQCPVFPGIRKRLFWPFDDPEDASGSDEEKREQIRKIRDQIKERITAWIESE